MTPMDESGTQIRASRNRSAAQKVVETIASVRCPCGHLHDRHRAPDPDWKVGDLREVRGACRDCNCKGEIA